MCVVTRYQILCETRSCVFKILKFVAMGNKCHIMIYALQY